MFSESGYYSEFKKIRNKFRKYRYIELIVVGIRYLNRPVKTGLEKAQRHPWLAMLFVKWLIQDEQFPNLSGKIATDDDFLSMLLSVHNLTDKNRLPSDYDHYKLYFRNIAYQQFIYQDEFLYTHISRQSLLFSTLLENHSIKKDFKLTTGLEINEFIELSLITLMPFLSSNETVLSPQWFAPIAHVHSPAKVDCFLACISKTMGEIRNELSQERGGRLFASDEYELTPFVKYPFINASNDYHLTNKYILYRCIETFIYDVLRRCNSERFMNKFGLLFERYIEDSIRCSGLPYQTESEIKKKFGVRGNQIDFVIDEPGVNIFIDAKAVEMSHQGKVTHSSEIIDKTKPSILKSITQAHDVLKKMQRDSLPPKINYLLVVTFKELYLSNGRTYYDIIAKDKMDEIYREYNSSPNIPPENMYFITVEDFDILCELARTNEMSITDVIEHCKKNDNDIKTMKFEFRMHLHTLNVKLKYPNSLIKEKDRIIKKIEGFFNPVITT